jgi:hypothetical protein
VGLKAILGGGLGAFAEKVGGVVDRFVQTKDEKAAVMLELEGIAAAQAQNLEETIRAELGAKERIMVAELQQGDNYTKRARPTVVYFGMLVIFLNYVVAPIVGTFMGKELEEFILPTEFWVAWGGIVATWSIGRTFERRGVQSKTLSVVTGNQPPPSILD